MNSEQRNRLTARLRQIEAAPALSAEAYVDVSPNAGPEPRSATYKPAGLTTPTGEQIAVVIKNLSPSGARLEFFRKINLPQRFWVAEATIPLRVWVEIIWRDDGAVGVRFIN